MMALNLSRQFQFSSGVFDSVGVQVVYEALRSGSTVFRDILDRIPENVYPTLGGGSLESHYGWACPGHDVM